MKLDTRTLKFQVAGGLFTEDIKTGTLLDGASGTDTVCVWWATTTCYRMIVNGGEWPSEISWSIAHPNDPDVIWKQGGAGKYKTICANSDLPSVSPTTATDSPTMTLMPTHTPTTAPTLDEGCFVLKLGDSWGDGWNGAIWTWRHAVPEGGMRGSVIATGTLQDGDSGTQYLPCYDPADPAEDGCYEFLVGTG